MSSLPIYTVMRFRQKEGQEIFEIGFQDFLPWGVVFIRLAFIAALWHDDFPSRSSPQRIAPGPHHGCRA